MKAKMKVLLPGFTGNMDDVVVYYNSQLNQYITRAKVSPKFTPSNQIVKDMFAFARRIDLTPGYKADCERYIRAYNTKNRRRGLALTSWPVLWMKIVRAQVKANPEIDLTTLTREAVLLQNLPMQCVAEAVEAGFLEKVRDWEDMTSII